MNPDNKRSVVYKLKCDGNNKLVVPDSSECAFINQMSKLLNVSTDDIKINFSDNRELDSMCVEFDKSNDQNPPKSFGINKKHLFVEQDTFYKVFLRFKKKIIKEIFLKSLCIDIDTRFEFNYSFVPKF